MRTMIQTVVLPPGCNLTNHLWCTICTKMPLSSLHSMKRNTLISLLCCIRSRYRMRHWWLGELVRLTNRVMPPWSHVVILDVNQDQHAVFVNLNSLLQLWKCKKGLETFGHFHLAIFSTIPEFSKLLTSATFTLHCVFTALHTLGSWLAVNAICCCWDKFYEWICTVRDASSASQETHLSKVYRLWF